MFFGPVSDAVGGGAAVDGRVSDRLARSALAIAPFACVTGRLHVSCCHARYRNRRLAKVDTANQVSLRIYGREEEARHALAGIDWKSKAPLVQALGLSAEGLIELFCQRDVPRALEITRRARALASVSSLVHGAAQTDRFHSSCVAVAEVLQNVESATSLKWLEEGAADTRYPSLQLIASFGLAIAAERAGNGPRAAQLRAFIQQRAPHCVPLHLTLEQFAAGHEAVRQPGGDSVSEQLASASPAAANTQVRSAKLEVAKAAYSMVGKWVVLLALFFVLYRWFFRAA